MTGLEGHFLGPGLAQLGLELDYVLIVAAQGLFQMIEIVFKKIGHFGGLGLFDQRRLCQVLAALGDGQLGLLGPILLEICQTFELAPGVFLIGDGAGRRRADLDQRFFHFLDNQPDDLVGLFGHVKYGIEVGIHDVCHACKNTHCLGVLLIV